MGEGSLPLKSARDCHAAAIHRLAGKAHSRKLVDIKSRFLPLRTPPYKGVGERIPSCSGADGSVCCVDLLQVGTGCYSLVSGEFGRRTEEGDAPKYGRKKGRASKRP